MRLDDRDARERVARVEMGINEVDALEDEHARSTALDTVQALLELYGEGLARVMAVVEEHGNDREIAALVDDELVSHLLMLHGLHPVDVETRVRQALAEVRPYLESHGGDVELVGVTDGVAHLRLQGSCNGCASSTATLKHAIEEAIVERAPDLDGVEAEGIAEPGVQPIIFCPDGIRPRAGSSVA